MAQHSRGGLGSGASPSSDLARSKGLRVTRIPGPRLPRGKSLLQSEPCVGRAAPQHLLKPPRDARLCTMGPSMFLRGGNKCSSSTQGGNRDWPSTCVSDKPKTQGAPHFFPRAALRRAVCLEGDCRVRPHSLPLQTPLSLPSLVSLTLFLCLPGTVKLQSPAWMAFPL